MSFATLPASYVYDPVEMFFGIWNILQKYGTFYKMSEGEAHIRMSMAWVFQKNSVFCASTECSLVAVVAVAGKQRKPQVELAA